MHPFIAGTSNYMAIGAGLIILVMAALTLLDVVFRYIATPIVGIYEVVAFLGAAAGGLYFPRAYSIKAHVSVDLLLFMAPPNVKKVIHILTRLAVLSMFAVGTYYLLLMSRNFIVSNTVTMSLRIPFYPVVFCMAAGCAIQCVVIFREIVIEWGSSGGSNG